MIKRYWFLILAILLMASVASAAVTRVICVPWQGNVLADHVTWDTKTALLKAVVHADSTATMTYTWNFGDGSPAVTGTLTGATKYNVETFHAYTGSVGTPYTATLEVNDGSNVISDLYRLRIQTFDLDAERAVAVDDALWWMYKQQYADGHWYSYSTYYSSATASAVHAFEVNNHLETGDPDQDPYVDSVERGLAYIFTTLRSRAIGPQTYGDPDANGNGIGIYVNHNRQIYEGGMIMDAIINSRTPTADSGFDFDGDGTNDTYFDVVQDMCDMYAWGQGDAVSGNNAGGWRYSWNSGADNSACQWAAIGMIPAERTWGCVIPQWVKNRNDVWLNYSYWDYGSYGGYGYVGPGNGYALTPSGMVQLAFVGRGTTDPHFLHAEDYFEIYWGNWVNSNNYYAYYAGFKAFSLALPAPRDTFGNGFDWYNGNGTTIGLAKRLVERQVRGTSAYRGRFDNYYGYVYASAWATIILSGFEPQPVAVVTADPNPTGQDILVTFDHSASYHLDMTKNIVLFEYDFDNDGTYDWSSGDPAANPTHPFHCPTYPATPCDFPVKVRVTDDSIPVKTDTAIVVVTVTPPPHPPTSDTGGPYTACPGEPIALDGSGSYDIDEPEGDSIVAWNWELDGAIPYDFDDVTGAVVSWTWPVPGVYDIALRVTDSYGLINTAWTTVHVDDQYCCTSIDDLTARAKRGKVQLVWTHVGADSYEVFRSNDGGATFNKIADTTSTYSTYLDASVTSGVIYQYYVKSGDTCDSNIVEILVPATRTR